MLNGWRLRDTWLVQLVLYHWATTNRKPPTLTILYMYCTGGTESCIQQSLSMCCQNPVRDWLQILSIRKEPMLSGFLGLNRLRKPLSTGGWWLCGYHSPVVRFPATSLVCFHFTLFTSKNIKMWDESSKLLHCDFTILFPSEDEYTIKFCSCCVKVCQQQQSLHTLLLNMFLSSCVAVDWTQH